MKSMDNQESSLLSSNVPAHGGDESPRGADVEVFDSFDDMGLKQELLRGLYSYGWEKPSEIQGRAVIPFVNGCDLIAQAQSGRGKTGAFCTASLQIVDENLQKPQVLILSPTRELADQSHNVLKALATYMGITTNLTIGGQNYGRNIRECQANPHVVVGTPGRLLDLIENRQALDVSALQCIVIDEADEMLSRGFRDTVYDIFQVLPQNVQVCLFSATFPQECLELSEKFMQNPTKILIKQEAVTLDGIQQFYVNCDQEHFKFDVLKDLYEMISVPQVIIFCKSREVVDRLADQMTQEEFTVSCIHGAMEQPERMLRMKEFRSGASRVLISTDLVARGIDVPTVQLVINYDLPFGNYENYIHRIGRSGRHGKKGVAINFLTNDQRDVRTLREIEYFFSTKIDELPGDICDLEIL